MIKSSGDRRCSDQGPLALTLVSLGLFALAMTPAVASDVTLTESGSTLVYPLFKLWVPDYASVAPNVTMTAAGTSSGAGIAAAISGEVKIGTSDAYMSDEQYQQNRGILNIPLAISAQTVNYNIPGLSDRDLRLNGPVIAGIYSGKIKTWDAPEITKLNPGIQLPHQAIVPIRRDDASGDTFIFTQFLDFSTRSWEDRVGYGTTVIWPTVADEKTAKGNEGMIDAVSATPYSLGYIGISFKDAIKKARIGTALLENQSGKFLLPTAATIDAAASSLDPRTPPDERLTLVFAPGEESYPLINYEYAVVSSRQPDEVTAKALRHFLLWAISLQGGNASKYLDSVGFIPLPDFIRALSEKQISLIKAVGEKS
jgi:phosphate transport system substrate-binding protein